MGFDKLAGLKELLAYDSSLGTFTKSSHST